MKKFQKNFFVLCVFLVVHMFLKTNDTVRKNGYFDSLWGGIQRCLSLRATFKLTSQKCKILWDSGVGEKDNHGQRKKNVRFLMPLTGSMDIQKIGDCLKDI